MSAEPPVKFIAASPQHEAFYKGVVDLAITLQLRDEEVAALVGKMLGYQRAYCEEAGTPASSVPHLTEVFRQNMRRGYRQIKNGTVKPHE